MARAPAPSTYCWPERYAYPALDEPGLYLSSIASLESGRGRVAEFTYADADVRELDLADSHLMDGRVLRLRSQRTVFEDLRVDSVEFSGCDLAAAAFDACAMERTEFGSGRYAGCDLRGNDLAAVRGVNSLRRGLIDRPQLLQLVQALAEDLDVAFGEDLQD
ncbi:hypothetical protein ABZ419_02955 [Streptomyces cinnamoneus]|uniref:hypothetical protein n=1 Tax=Streptomyces cinnamoneus TaxID=53446 RepID=UPI0034096362